MAMKGRRDGRVIKQRRGKRELLRSHILCAATPTHKRSEKAMHNAGGRQRQYLHNTVVARLVPTIF